MSGEVCVRFEIRSMAIMKDTLKQMGIEYNDLSQDEISIRRNYHNIIINSHTGNITYDEVDNKKVDNIKQNYMVSFYKDKAIREGMQLKEEVNAKGEVVLTLTR